MMVKQPELLRQTTERSSSGSILWEYLCGCGNKFKAKPKDIERGHTKSCGCLKLTAGDTRETQGLIYSPPPDIVIRDKFSQYRRNAKRKSLKFSISVDDFKELVSGSCFYCGDFYLHGVGLDRLSNEQGYELDNVVPCCSRCNYIKGRLSFKEFSDFISKVFKNLSHIGGEL